MNETCSNNVCGREKHIAPAGLAEICLSAFLQPSDTGNGLILLRHLKAPWTPTMLCCSTCIRQSSKCQTSLLLPEYLWIWNRNYWQQVQWQFAVFSPSEQLRCLQCDHFPTQQFSKYNPSIYIYILTSKWVNFKVVWLLKAREGISINGHSGIKKLNSLHSAPSATKSFLGWESFVFLFKSEDRISQDPFPLRFSGGVFFTAWIRGRCIVVGVGEKNVLVVLKEKEVLIYQESAGLMQVGKCVFPKWALR